VNKGNREGQGSYAAVRPQHALALPRDGDPITKWHKVLCATVRWAAI
jgi:hypothetical protein